MDRALWRLMARLLNELLVSIGSAVSECGVAARSHEGGDLVL